MSLRRRKCRRQTRRPILIVCEGYLEQTYFDILKSLPYARERLSLQICCTCGGRHPKVLEKAGQLVSAHGHGAFDEIWCVFDTEGAEERNRLRKTIDQCRRKKFKVALSNPCFDAWALVHLGAWPDGFLSQQDCKARLNAQCNENADVTNSAWMKQHIFGGDGLPNLIKAMKAARCFEPDAIDDILANNPSTSACTLIHQLWGPGPREQI